MKNFLGYHFMTHHFSDHYGTHLMAVGPQCQESCHCHTRVHQVKGSGAKNPLELSSLCLSLFLFSQSLTLLSPNVFSLLFRFLYLSFFLPSPSNHFTFLSVFVSFYSLSFSSLSCSPSLFHSLCSVSLEISFCYLCFFQLSSQSSPIKAGLNWKQKNSRSYLSSSIISTVRIISD